MNLSNRWTKWLISAGATVAVAAASLAAWWARPEAAPFDMVATLRALADREGIWDSAWDKPAQKMNFLRERLSRERDPGRRYELMREIAGYAMTAGSSELAIATLEDLRTELGATMSARQRAGVEAAIAFAYFRLGELQNCGWNHNADSCLFPVAGEGVHAQRLGMTEAARRYRALLEDPATSADEALHYRWLLNIAHMTLGTYPLGVPARWRIAPEAFKSDYDIGLFRDVAASSGVVELGQAGGVVLEDFDNDGDLDILVSHMGLRDQVQYFRNNGDGTFTRATHEAGLDGIVGGLNMVQADYDNDGCIDVLILRGAWLHDTGRFPPSLLHNNCDGTFTDVTAKAGLLAFLPSQTAAWADVNGDGLLDLFIGYEIMRQQVRWPEGTPGFRLYVNNGDGTFTERGAGSGISVEGMIKGAVWGDYDNDGRPDLHVSVLGGPNHLYRNVTAPGGGPRFEDVTARAGVAEPLKSFTTWFFDYDNDGWPDLFVAGYSAPQSEVVKEVLGRKDAQGERSRLYHNNHDGTFTDVSRAMHVDGLYLTMGANFGDLDNDGWPDFYLGTGVPALDTLVPNRMFRNDAGRRFQDVTTSGGFGHLQKGHGVAFGDVDGDGQQDVFEVMGGAVESDKFWCVLYRNPGHVNHWIKLRLAGVHANRSAIGARIRVVVETPSGAREIHHTVSSGGSFGASSLRPHIGLGPAATVKLLEVRWPGSGLVQRFEGPIAADATYAVTEGLAALQPFVPPPPRRTPR